MDDALSSLLHGVRPRGALFDQSAHTPPWSLRFQESTPLVLLTMITGDAWVTMDGHAPLPLAHGDVVIVVGPQPYTVSDEPGAPPLSVVHGAGRRPAPDGPTPLTGRPVTGYAEEMAGATSVLLKSTYQVRGGVSQRVLSALPPIARVPALPDGCPTLALITGQLTRNAPGQQVMLDRLLDLLLVSVLRFWFEGPDGQAPAWYRAHGDPLVSGALRLMHGDPASPWTVSTLAAEVGASRARFAQRFTELMGQSPMAYLTEWRICQAADLLEQTDDTVDAVAHQVGYSNAYALSVAFKRTVGVRPGEHRARSRAAGTEADPAASRAG